jgi:FkbM family methyltransferase
VSDEAHEVVFREFRDSELSSVSDEHVAQWEGHSDVIRCRRVATETLTDILARFRAPSQFHLLSIDVEGHDYEVLRSLDLARFRPRLVVIEMHDFDLAAPNDSAIYRHLIHEGYRMVGYSTWNGFFLDERP